MQQNKHSATEETSAEDRKLRQLVLTVPPVLKWDLKALAVSRRTTFTRLAVAILEEYVAREKQAAA